jgi:hypothetical protein
MKQMQILCPQPQRLTNRDPCLKHQCDQETVTAVRDRPQK